MQTIMRLIIAAALSTLSGYAQAADTVKPLQAVSFHTETKDAVAYYLVDNGACKAVLTSTDKAAYAPTRVETVVDAHKVVRHQLDEANVVEFACQADARAMVINMLATVAGPSRAACTHLGCPGVTVSGIGF
jgi:hypothetical protein